jgi:hypothetical protein
MHALKASVCLSPKLWSDGRARGRGWRGADSNARGAPRVAARCERTASHHHHALPPRRVHVFKRFCRQWQKQKGGGEGEEEGGGGGSGAAPQS